MTEQEQTNNPYNICIWRPVSECTDCTIAGRLKCHFKLGDLLHFMGLFLSIVLPAIIGMVLGGYSWYILGWLVLLAILLGVWEIRVLCSHCPYFAEKDSTLRCFANYGLYKLWRYHPGPISRSGKIQFVIILILLTCYPFPFLILGGQYILAFLTAWGIAISGWTLQKFHCSQCVNFSCVLNRVPEEVVDEFLKRNPVMREAWEESGWQTGNTNS